MSDITAKFKLSIKDGVLEISGSEKFVKKMTRSYEDLIEDMLETSMIYWESETEDEFYDMDDFLEDQDDEMWDASFVDHTDEDEEAIEMEFVSGEELPSLEGEEIVISGDIPGGSVSSRTVNAALLYAYTRSLQGHNKASVDEIRNICKIHDILDKNNFSTYIKIGAPEYYKDSGKGKSRTLKLTETGKKRAQELIASISVE